MHYIAMKQSPTHTALITGGAKHLGAAIAIGLAKQGINVAVHCHTSKNDAQKTVQEVKKYSRGCAVTGDVSRPDDVHTMFGQTEKAFGPVDILVNVVGNFLYEPITGTTFETFRDVIESNLYGTFLCCRRALPAMQKRGWGRIINFGCIAADSLTIRKNTTPYYIAKTGVIMLTKVLAHEYSKDGITVNSVSPGILETSVAKPPTPSGKYAQFSDIINTIQFFLKEESHYVNGANIEVAGGWRPGFT